MRLPPWLFEMGLDNTFYGAMLAFAYGSINFRAWQAFVAIAVTGFAIKIADGSMKPVITYRLPDWPYRVTQRTPGWPWNPLLDVLAFLPAPTIWWIIEVSRMHEFLEHLRWL